MGVDLARCGCAMDMVDGLVEHLDLALSEHGMVGLTHWSLRAVREGFSSAFFVFSSFIFRFFKWSCRVSTPPPCIQNRRFPTHPTHLKNSLYSSTGGWGVWEVLPPPPRNFKSEV